MSNHTLVTDEQIDAYMMLLRADLKKHGSITVQPHKKGKQKRTPTQNRCLHKFCDQLAIALNDAGYDFREFVREGYPVPWNEDLAKEYIWRPIQKAMTGKESTTQPTPKEYVEIYEVLNAKMVEYGIHVPWPNRFQLGEAA